jgi:enoyl-CoA hydratase/carnithine racemase
MDADTHNADDIVHHLQPGTVDVITRFRKPVISAVQRHCVGVGVEFVAAADITVAADDAVFFLPQVSLGILPGAGGITRLVRRIGETWAARLILTGERIDAATALRIGLVSEVVPRDELTGRVTELATSIAGFPTAAVQLAKEAVLEAPEVPLATGLRVDKYRLFVLSGTDEKKASHAAFATRDRSKVNGE